MKPDHAKTVAEVIGQNLQGEWMHTYKAINAVPDAKKDYQPEANSRSAWDLAHHIAICDVGSLHAVAANNFGVFPAKCDAKTIPELADWYKHEMPKALEKVLALDGNHLSQTVEAFGMKLPSVNYLMFCNNHMIHHRGQLTTYIRPAGGKVPAMYGGSFDEVTLADSVKSASALSLCLVLAGTALVPFGLRAVNGVLPGADIKASYLPTIETPRPRERFDEAAASALREAQPEYMVIGDSMAGVRINPAALSKRVGRSVAGVYQQGSPVAYWYLAFKNLVADNQLRNIRGAVFFFRDDQLTTQVVVDPRLLDRVARAQEPELDRVLAAHRLGRFSGVHRAARSAYGYDRTREWLEPRLTRAPAIVADDPNALLASINTDLFALDKLRKFAASDLAQADDAMLDFDRQVDRSLLPEILRMAKDAGIRVAFVRAQRRPTESGPPPESEALTAYLQKLEQYLAARGAYYHDDRGDPEQSLSIYADGDHLTGRGRELYTERFAERHARFFQ